MQRLVKNKLHFKHRLCDNNTSLCRQIGQNGLEYWMLQFQIQIYISKFQICEVQFPWSTQMLTLLSPMLEAQNYLIVIILLRVPSLSWKSSDRSNWDVHNYSRSDERVNSWPAATHYAAVNVTLLWRFVSVDVWLKWHAVVFCSLQWVPGDKSCCLDVVPSIPSLTCIFACLVSYDQRCSVVTRVVKTAHSFWPVNRDQKDRLTG